MKTIFRYTNPALLMAVIIAFGTAAGLAQDPCADAEGQTKLGDMFRTQFADKGIDGRKAAIETGKQFLEKYGACPSVEELATYLKGQLPKMELTYKNLVEAKAKSDLTSRFDTALKAKNWDQTFALGKEILQKYPDEFRTVEIVLGSVGGEEALTKNNFKYSEDTLKYAKQSIADLEAKKPFVIGKDTKYGIYEFSYKTPEEAIAWLNLYIGWVTQVGQKNKAAALPYLYKATQAADTKGKAAPYDLIGSYYIDELNKIYEEIQLIAKSQDDPGNTEEVTKQKLEAIKAKVALANATAERTMDALARAANFTTDVAVKAKLKTTLQEIYKRRFDKTEGVDAWIASATAKPFVNPQTPIQPVVDPEAVKPGATTTTTTPPATEKPAPPATKPAATIPKPAVEPAAKPVSIAKPRATVKKKVVKKRTT